jgi:uncharacterized protein YprB with RNaseH-like and TPR domain
MTKQPKVLIYDIETSNLAANFGIVFCIGWKWAGVGKKVNMISIRDNKRAFTKDPTNDKHVIQEFSKVINQADAIVAHFGDKFDKPYLNTKCLEHGLQPFSAVPQIDTCKEAWKRLKFNSNRLDAIAKFLKLDVQKTPIDNRSWIKAPGGHIPSIKEIEHHCVMDILVLEQVYLKMRPFMPSHPNLSALHGDRLDCSVCGGKMVYDGVYATTQGKRQRNRCKECGHTKSVAMKAPKKG